VVSLVLSFISMGSCASRVYCPVDGRVRLLSRVDTRRHERLLEMLWCKESQVVFKEPDYIRSETTFATL